ncbi:MAG: hypothetical protein NUV50_03135 [Rhodospirillales bacterium]|nr:hypothetical protein [Rhodospirillales bacterium]
MARKPNYDFERRERDRLKAEKKAQRAAAKTDSRNPEADLDDQGETSDAEPTPSDPQNL